MDRFAVRSAMVLGLSATLFAIGCEDPKARIAQLEEDLSMSQQDLAAAQKELEAALASRDRSSSDLAALRQQIADLQAKLDQKPEVPAEWNAVPGGAMTSIPGELLFNSGKADLHSGGSAKLSRVAQVLQERFPGRDIYVFGHTDAQPIRRSKWKDNYELSCERALTVVRYLKGQSVDAGRLVACGWGENRPASSNSTEAGRSKNRRVEIFAMEPTVALAAPGQ